MADERNDEAELWEEARRKGLVYYPQDPDPNDLGRIDQKISRAIREAARKAIGHVIVKGSEPERYLVFSTAEDARALDDALTLAPLGVGSIATPAAVTSNGTHYMLYQPPSSHPSLALRTLIDKVVKEKNLPERTLLHFREMWEYRDVLKQRIEQTVDAVAADVQPQQKQR